MTRVLEALRNVSPSTGFRIRFSVAVTLAVWLGKAPGLVENHSTWILITVLMVVQPTTGGALVKGLLRAFGTIVAAFTAILLFGLFAQDPPRLMAGLFAVQVLAAYGFSGPRNQYAFFVFGFTTSIVLGDAMAGKGAVETIAFQRASMVCIGVLIVFVVDSIFWPVSAEKTLRHDLAARARGLAIALRNASAPVPSESEGMIADRKPGALANQFALIGAARSELGASPQVIAGLQRIILLFETLDSRIRTLGNRFAGVESADETSRVAVAKLGEAGARQLEASADSLEATRWAPSGGDDLEHLLLELENDFEAAAPRGQWSSARTALVANLTDIVAVLERLETRTSDTSTSPRRAIPSLRFRVDPLRTKVGFRTGAAVIASFLTVMALGWATNTLVAAISFMIAAMPRGKALRSLAGLAIVVGLGWAIADLTIVFVTPFVSRGPESLLTVFLLSLFLVWLGTSRPALAMLPAIGGVVAILSVFGGPAPATNVEASYDTVCYLALAVGVGWLFGRIMWPSTAASGFRGRIALQLAACLGHLSEERDAVRENRAQHKTAFIQAFMQQSAALDPLDDLARSEPVELALDAERRGLLRALLADLMDALVDDRATDLAKLSAIEAPGFGAMAQAIEREDEALRASLNRVVDAMRTGPVEPTPELADAQKNIDAKLDEARALSSVPLPIDAEQRHSILVALDARRRLVGCQQALEAWLEEWATVVASGARQGDPT